jgi:hypothetical protein
MLYRLKGKRRPRIVLDVRVPDFFRNRDQADVIAWIKKNRAQTTIKRIRQLLGL